MTQSYVQRKPAQTQQAPMQKSELSPAAGASPFYEPGLSSLNAIGHPVDLPGAIREKFENAFGADLSAVKLYQSQAVADAGAQAVTMGEKVAFAPGMLDFSSREGLTLLGHEMSHVVSQQRGEVAGAGFLHDPALEARADREGAMAAAGQQIAAPTAAMSSSTAASASGPMQAKKDINAMTTEYMPEGAEAEDLMPNNSLLRLDNQKGTTNPYSAVGDTADTASKASQNVKFATDHAKIAQNAFGATSKITDARYADVAPKQLKEGPWGGHWSPIISGIGGGLGVLSGGMTAYSSGASAIRNLKNAKAGASKADALEDGLTSLGGVGTALMGGVSVGKAVSSGFANMLAQGGKLSGLMPWLSIGTGAVNAAAGGMQTYRGLKRLYQINKQLGSVDSTTPDPDDQAIMKRTMQHGIEIQKRNATVGALKTVAGGLSIAGGALTMGGVTSALGLGLSAAGGLLTGIGSIYNLWKNRRLRKNAIAQELGGMNYMDAVKEVRNRLKGTHGYISRGNAWKIFLQSRGKGDQSEESMYSDIRRRRAAHMLELAEGGNDTAKNFIKSMGVNQIDDGAGNMTFTEGALDLLAEKLK